MVVGEDGNGDDDNDDDDDDDDNDDDDDDDDNDKVGCLSILSSPLPRSVRCVTPDR